jgi:SAM-dependent methyltransferase
VYRARSCPCCKATDHEAYPALVSPFLSSYVLGTTPKPTRLLECTSCGFRFFEDRLTDREAERLYADYRGEPYYRARHRYEPWYTRKANEAVGADATVARTRRANVEGFLREHVDVAAIDDVLDFGGDRGQLIPEGIGRRRFVYEISGAETVEGVTRLASEADLRGHRFDLVLLCHVLEHCSEPSDVLAQVRPLMRSNDSVLYVEVPYERASLGWLGRSKAYASYLGAIGRVRPLLTAVDLYSTLFRIRWNAVPPLGFVKMHEHINFFDERSLSTLLAQNGFTVLTSKRMSIRSPLGETPVLGAVARLTR